MTFRDGAHAEALANLRKHAGLTKAKLMSSADFGLAGADMGQISEGGGFVLNTLAWLSSTLSRARRG